MKIVTIHQPLYLPWLGLFHKLLVADEICLLDNVKFSFGDYVNRNTIRFENSRKHLSIPLKKESKYLPIKDIKPIDDSWKKKHLSSLRHSYSKSPYFYDYFPELESLIEDPRTTLLKDLNFKIIKFACKNLEINKPFYWSSELNLRYSGSEMINEIVTKLNGNRYFSGALGKDYINECHFPKIEIKYQDFKHPIYKQRGESFFSGLSFIDALFNLGPNVAGAIKYVNQIKWDEIVRR